MTIGAIAPATYSKLQILAQDTFQDANSNLKNVSFTRADCMAAALVDLILSSSTIFFAILLRSSILLLRAEKIKFRVSDTKDYLPMSGSELSIPCVLIGGTMVLFPTDAEISNNSSFPPGDSVYPLLTLTFTSIFEFFFEFLDDDRVRDGEFFLAGDLDDDRNDLLVREVGLLLRANCSLRAF